MAPAVLVLLGVLGSAGACQAGPLFALGGRTASAVFPNALAARLANAACSGNAAQVAALARIGADVNARGLQGITPLIWAMTCHNTTGMRALLQAGANPNLPMAAREVNRLGIKTWELATTDCTNKPFDGDFVCQPPVYLAAGGNDPKVLAVLLEHGGNPNALSQNHISALMNAASLERLDNVKLLVAHGVDVNYSQPCAFPCNHSVLFVAANRYEVVLYLLQHAKFSRANLQEYADRYLSLPQPGASGFGSAPTDNPFYKLRPQVVAYFKAQGIVPHSDLPPVLDPAPLPDPDRDKRIREQDEWQRRAEQFRDRAEKNGKLCLHVAVDSFGHLYCDNTRY